MSKLTDDLRACDPIASPNVAGMLMDRAAGYIELLEEALDGVAAYGTKADPCWCGGLPNHEETCTFAYELRKSASQETT